MNDDVTLTREPQVADDAIFSGSLPIGEALEKLRLRLLDLTARNRLLNFKHPPAKSLQFVEGRTRGAFERLVLNNARLPLVGLPEPRQKDFVEEQGRKTRPEARAYAEALGIRTSTELPANGDGDDRANGALRTLLYADELERACRRIAREAKTAIEETGANMLFLLLGFLEYPEAPQGGRSMLAPLICVPVSLERGELERSTGTYRYSLSYTGEELTENLSLREKLRVDFNLELPDFTEEEETSTFYEVVKQAISGRPGFEFRNQATLALISMTKMLLVRDLDPKNWPKRGRGTELTEHDVVRMVFAGGSAASNSDGDEYDVDNHRLAELPVIFDADSSQHSALIDVADGKNLVIEGPPGTGKSQTITNLVGHAISEGKKVLFVAEKVAALQVVKSRLTAAGLSDFCLELHSNKTSKKEVLESIGRRIEKKFPKPPHLEAMLEALSERRKTLSGYVHLINSEAGNAQGLTVHEVLWKAERYRQQVGTEWTRLNAIKIERSGEITRAEFETLFDQLSRLCKEYDRIGRFDPDSPFWGFYPTTLNPGAAIEIEQILAHGEDAARRLEASIVVLEETIPAQLPTLDPEELAKLAERLGALNTTSTAPVADDVLSTMFSARDPKGRHAERAIERLAGYQQQADSLHSVFSGRINDEIAPAIALEAAKRIESTLSSLGLLDECAVSIEATGVRCVELSNGLVLASESLSRIATEIGLTFDGTERSEKAISVPIALAAECPVDLLHLRNAELAAVGSAETIREAQRTLGALARNKAALSQSFYLDSSVSEAELEEALFALREGDEWWRFLEGRQRRALALHRRLARDKSSMPRRDRRSHLEELLAYRRNERNTIEDRGFLAAAGSQWRGRETEFEKLIKLATWLEKSVAATEAVGLNSQVFPATTIASSRVASLACLGERLRACLAVFRQCEDFATQTSPLAAVGGRFKQLFLETTNWTGRSELLADTGGTLIAIAKEVSQLADDRQSFKAILRSVRTRSEYSEIVEKAAQDDGLATIFGARHKGIETDLPPIKAAFDFGSAVVDLGLPSAVHDALLKGSGATLHKQLLAILRGIADGWTQVDRHLSDLANYGLVEAETFAGCPRGNRTFARALHARLAKARSGIPGLLQWAQYVDASMSARQGQLRPFVDLLEQGQLPTKALTSAFGYRFYGSIAERVFEKHPRLGRFSGLSHEAIRAEFQKLDRDVVAIRGKEIAWNAARLARPPLGTSGVKVNDKTELTLIEYLLPQSRPRVPIRRLMKAAGRAVQSLKPCFMMGPQAVAQYLLPGAVYFDLVVMDEASQLKPEEALGSIARGAQLVVVGDPKQLPPTTFFDKLGETADAEDIGEQIALMQQSILDVCMGHFKPVRTLRWHYRSQHESLIAFSNARFYRNKLIVFPAAYDASRVLGAKCKYVPGATYANSVNLVEAKVVVDAVLDHMRDRPLESLGVVTLNLKQRELIEELLDKRVRELDFAEEYCARHEKGGQDFFVKNLENVQGDERDCIFISFTFGPAPGTTVVYQRFGPISREDGWRRLNVLFTRARRSLTVFSSMRPEDINDGPTVPRGSRELRRYLEYLRTGAVPAETEDGESPESDFEVAVIEVLEQNGYTCKPQHGVAGFRIDVVIRHPDHANAYLAAIECDGASYHSGRSARDRDRIRQTILESLGWKGRIYRIWSSDWYRAPGSETERLLNWLRELRQKPFDTDMLGASIDNPFDVGKKSSITETTDSDETLKELGLPVVEDDLEVQVGDTVTYRVLSTNQEQTVTIVGRNESGTSGHIAHTAPIAQVLLGLLQGEMVTLEQPGRPPLNIRVMRIQRPPAEGSSSS